MKLLYENEYIPSNLAPLIKENASLHTYFEHGFKGIKPKNTCGFLSVDGESYFIVPKIIGEENAGATNLDIFIFMLLYAYDVPLKNEDLQQGESVEERLFEVFIRMFSDRLLDELKRGVFKQYITLQENLRVLRGKYLIEKNFANFYHQNLFCEFDEFSMDNKLNRFFLYALRTFQKVSNYPNLHRCEAMLDEVSFFNVDLKRLHLQFDRMNSRYEKSYEIARMILDHLVPLTGKSGKKSFAFLFDMAEVFEKFVARLFKEIDPTTKLQHQKNFGSLQLKPDIVTDSLIIDTKYKSVRNRDELALHDKYQMFVYGTNFKQKNVLLLYPKHHVDVKEDLVLGRDEDEVYLKMRSLDLGYNGGYEGFIAEMRKRVGRY